MSDTPIYEQLRAEQMFRNRSGPLYTEDNEPPSVRGMTLENVYGQRIRWNGKRWHDVSDDGSLQTQDCWPPYDYGPVLWREVDVP